jgi:hypothetical protein
MRLREVDVNQQQEYPALALVVVRLMAIALRVATRSVAAPVSTQPPLSFGYRSWPTYQIAGLRQGHQETLKFYVCAKGAATPDNEPFSMGTRFVMETYRIEEGLPRKESAQQPVRHELVQVFIMQKYASLETSGLPSCIVDGWLCATLVQAGLMAPGRGRAFRPAPSRSARVTIGAGLRGWTALTTQGVPTEGSVCPYVSLSHILPSRYLRTVRFS